MGHAAVIEIIDRDGHCRETHRVRAWPLRIGRSPHCDLVLSDPHVAAEHALLHWGRDEHAAELSTEASAEPSAEARDDERPVLELLPSHNGGWLEQRKLAAGSRETWPASEVLQIGTTRLRLRTSLDALPDEQAVSAADWPVKRTRRPAWALPTLLAAWVVILLIINWAGDDGSATWVDVVSLLLKPVAAALIWAAVWALITQLFRHWFAFGAHLWRVVVAGLAFVVLGAVVPLTAYMFNLPRLLVIDQLAMSVGGAALLWWHASVVWPRASRRVAVGVGAMALIGLVLTVGGRGEQQYWLGPSYMATLAPPALRLAQPTSVDSFVDGMDKLEAPLLRQAVKRNEQAGGSGDSDE